MASFKLAFGYALLASGLAFSGAASALTLNTTGLKANSVLTFTVAAFGSSSAAGITFRPLANMTRLAKYSAELYYRLEAETGVATGMKRVGSMTVALTPDRMEEIARQATIASIFGVEVHRITPDEVKALWDMTTKSAAKLMRKEDYGIAVGGPADLVVLDLNGDRETAVTADGEGLITWATAEFIAQEEMDRDTGYWWSPDERYIALQRQ